VALNCLCVFVRPRWQIEVWRLHGMCYTVVFTIKRSFTHFYDHSVQPLLNDSRHIMEEAKV